MKPNDVCYFLAPIYTGNTFKFSITPEFGFYNGTVQCHMKRVQSGIRMLVDQTLDFTNTLVGTKRWSYGFSTPNWTVSHSLQIRDDHRMKRFLSDGIQMEILDTELTTDENLAEEQSWPSQRRIAGSDGIQETILLATFQNKSKSMSQEAHDSYRIVLVYWTFIRGGTRRIVSRRLTCEI